MVVQASSCPLMYATLLCLTSGSLSVCLSCSAAFIEKPPSHTPMRLLQMPDSDTLHLCREGVLHFNISRGDQEEKQYEHAYGKTWKHNQRTNLVSGVEVILQLIIPIKHFITQLLHLFSPICSLLFPSACFKTRHPLLYRSQGLEHWANKCKMSN